MPLSFFLDYAWDPNRFPVETVGESLASWELAFAELHWGQGPASEIASILHSYGTLQSRRKPELLNRKISLDPDRDLATDRDAVVYDDQATPFSLTDYREMERVTAEWEQLADRARRVERALPAEARIPNQLVLYPVTATENLYALRLAQFTNLLYAEQGRSATNELADVVEQHFAADAAMSDYYNTVLAGGKWRGFQTQPKLGYGDVERYGADAGWQQPQWDNVAIVDQVFPPVRRIEVPLAARMGVALDGWEGCWPEVVTRLPNFSPYQRQPPQYIEVFNRGATPFDVALVPAEP